MSGSTDQDRLRDYYGGRAAWDLIVAAGHGESFAIGCIIKYATRLGKKPGGNKSSDLDKIDDYSKLLRELLDDAD